MVFLRSLIPPIIASGATINNTLTPASHKQLAAGNEREAAGLLWKASEVTFLDLAHRRGIECDGNLIELAKTLDANGAVTKRYRRSRLGEVFLLRDRAEMDLLESRHFGDVYEDTPDFVL